MARAVAVAEYILEKKGAMTAMKLEKLVYYSQAWHLAWTEKPLFPEKIEAWRDGPVIRELFELHKGQFKLKSGFFVSKLGARKIGPLSNDEKDVIDRVLSYYGDKDPHWLSQLTHLEAPWKNARALCEAVDNEASSVEISHKSIFEYYSSL